MGFVAIPVRDEPQDGLLELARVVEAAETQHAALEDGEPDLDLVEPGGVQGREDELEATVVPRVESAPPLLRAVFVNVEVVPDDDDSPSGVTTRDPRHEAQHRGRVATLYHFAEHLAISHVESSEQRARTMTDVLELPPQAAISGASRGISAGQRLHGFLVDAQEDRVLRWVEVELANAPDLGSEVRIRAMQPRTNPMRAEPTRLKHPMNRGTADVNARAHAQLPGNGVERPDLLQGRLAAVGTTARDLHDLAASLEGDGRRTPGTRGIEKGLEAWPLPPARAPLVDGADGAREPSRHRRRSDAICAEEDHPHPLGERLWSAAATNTGFQALTLADGDMDRGGQLRHAPLNRRTWRDVSMTNQVSDGRTRRWTQSSRRGAEPLRTSGMMY